MARRPHPTRTCTLISLTLVAAACGGGDRDPAGGADAGDTSEADAAPPDAAPPDAAVRTIRGVWNVRYTTEAGEEERPLDLTGIAIEALVPPDFEPIAGTTGEGTFEIEGVPEGPYLLRVDRLYFQTDRDTIDLSYRTLGRAGAPRATMSPTTVVLDVDDLAPWQAGDELQLYSTGGGTAAFHMEDRALAGAPVEGETSLSGFAYDLVGRTLPDGGAGDRVTVSQLATASDGDHTYRRLVRTFEPAPFSIADGGTANLTGAFTALAESETFAFAWDRPAFDQALREAGPPDLDPLSWGLLVLHTQPEAEPPEFYASSADLVIFEPGWTDDTSAVTGAWPYAPYPRTWPEMVTARWRTYRLVGLDGTDPAPVYHHASVDLPRAQVSPGMPIRPLIGPVRRPLVAGRSAGEPIDGVGTTPTLAWDPPSIGEATAYVVTISHLLDAGGTTLIVFVAMIQTRETALTIPPGLLESGETYLFRIQALATPGVDLEATPLAGSLPQGAAEIATSTVRP